MSSLCTEAAMYPLREAAASCGGDLKRLRESDVAPISRHHFDEALRAISGSVSQSDLQKYVDWNIQYGTYRRMD
jgi:SpoVK/Ycf46/Vps4 family AAA+-type ATPase